MIYVDNKDIIYININEDKSYETEHQTLKYSITTWGNLLISTGGPLQPIKLFYTLIPFEWKDGKWADIDNHLNLSS